MSAAPRAAIPNWLWLGMLWLVWGLSWPAMRAVFLEIPVWQFRAVTCFIGGVALLAMSRLAGGSLSVPRAQWGALIAAAFFNMTFWHVAIGYGLSMIGAGHGAVVAYTMPVWTALLSAVFLKERLTLRVVAALALGVAAVAVLLSHDFTALSANPLGFAFVLASAIGWAFGTIINKRVAWTVGMSALAGWQLVLGFVPIAIIAALTERFMMHEAATETLMAVAYLVFFGLIAGYALWYKVVEIYPATIGAIGTLVIPCIGVASGALVLGEPVGWRELAALGLVLSAVALVMFASRGTGPYR